MPIISEMTRYLWDTLDQPEKVALATRPEPLIQLRSRRQTLARFRDQWDGRGDWHQAFLTWLAADQAGDRGPDQVLIGTRVAQALHRVGADRVAAAYTRITGKDCGCDKREAAMNRGHKKIKGVARAVINKTKETIRRA